MDINTENNKFSSSKKTKKRLNIQEENLMFPPIQTVFELPPMKTKDPIIEPLKPLSVKKQEKKDKLKNILQQPTVIHEGTKEGTKEGMKEGMSESGQKFKQTLKDVQTAISNFTEIVKTYSYYALREGCYWFVKEDIQLLGGVNEESPTEEELKTDTDYLMTFVILILILPFCVFSTYNWYYLLFYQDSLTTSMDFDSSYILSNPIVNFFLEFVLVPVKLLDLLLFKWIPSMDEKKNWSPYQSVNFILILCIIVLFSVNYMQNNVFNIGIICFLIVYGMATVYALSLDSKILFYALLLLFIPVISILTLMGQLLGDALQSIDINALLLAIIVIAWGKWAFTYVASLFVPPSIPPSLVILVLNGLYILFRLIVSISLVKLATTLIGLYLLFNSFFGIMRFEKSLSALLQGMIPYIRRKDGEFFQKHHLQDTLLKFLNDFIYGRFIWIGWIILSLFYIVNIQTNVSSINLQLTLRLLLLLFIVGCITVLYIWKPVECANVGGSSTTTEINKPVLTTDTSLNSSKSIVEPTTTDTSLNSSKPIVEPTTTETSLNSSKPIESTTTDTSLNSSKPSVEPTTTETKETI